MQSSSSLASSTDFDYARLPSWWIPDDKVDKCSACYTGFGFFLRKHHCRRCGQIYCWKCTSRKLILPSVSPDPVRVCDGCYNYATDTLLFKQSTLSTNNSNPASDNSAGTIEVIGTTPLIEDELIQHLEGLGLSRARIHSFTVGLTKKGLLPAEISNLLQTLVGNTKKSGEALIVHIDEADRMREEVKQLRSKMNELTKLVSDLRRSEKEKDDQIRSLTGGFDYGTYQKVRASQKIEKEEDPDGNECVVCYEHEASFKTSCGCEKICALCYYRLASPGGRKVCPSCMKPID
jgi:hypothetical protein